jgi:peptidylprolyl isomerase
MIVAVAVAVACGVRGRAIPESEPEPEGPPTFTEYPKMAVEAIRPYSVIFTTSLGRMTFKLLPEESLLAVNSFVFLVGQGFYNGMTIERLVPGKFAETGDPIGTGNAGYTYEIEPPQRPYTKGTLLMANSGASGSNGSKFLIILDDLTDGDLPPDYTVFGHLKADHKPSERTLEKIAAATVGPGADGELTVPQNPIEIREVKVTEGCLPGMSHYASGSYGNNCGITQ